MSSFRIGARVAFRLAAAVLILPAAGSAQAAERPWSLPPGSVTQAQPAPPEWLRPLPRDEAARQRVAAGRLVFRFPGLLGGEAGRAGLSCESCHPSGHVHGGFFIPGLSGRPGTIDLTSSAFYRPERDNGAFDPVAIPSLRGVASRRVFFRDRRATSLSAAAASVIEDEFGGSPPPLAIQAALLAYLRQLDRTDRGIAAPDWGALGSRALASLIESRDGPAATLLAEATRHEAGRFHAAATGDADRDHQRRRGLTLGRLAEAARQGDWAAAQRWAGEAGWR